ncbi:M56 family metallopeptidase [Thalassotalea sp. PP2-459]|uniref:M56 family metallopeptidase n=1 Tax=Thalassotalea sp. PP2-459 TaxID=1742724 RepID=UPI000945D3F2|nr:M56 family metallopeptidase [Thalassotalea sp. PP2-459]OKY27809.1 peptidase M56, BlaR1 [Thalassotalea sp. PP2-459]
MPVFFNLLAIFSITFIVANVSLSTIFSLVSQQILKIEVKSRKILLWTIVLLPWVVSFVLSIYILQAYHSGNSLNSFAFPHWHHMTNFEWYSWHGFTVGVALFYVMYVLMNQVRHLWNHKREIESLISFAKNKEADVYQIESDKASAFTSGFFSKKCFVTTALIEQTTLEEYEVVIKHERAHIATNDPAKKWLFTLLCSFFIKPIAQRLKLHMILAMEQEADNAVIKSGTSKLFVASTLVKVAKLNAQSDIIENKDLVVNFGADVLEQRIFFLLDRLKLEPIHKSITLLLMMVLVTISTASIDGIHHFMETYFRH